jgi:hypothetical protein
MSANLLPLIFALTTGLLFTTAGSAGAQLLQPGYVDEFVGNPRVVVLSDMGFEPDDQIPEAHCRSRICSRVLGADRRFERVVALPEKNCSACRFPPMSFDVQIEQGISRSIPSGIPAPKPTKP